MVFSQQSKTTTKQRCLAGRVFTLCEKVRPARQQQDKSRQDSLVGEGKEDSPVGEGKEDSPVGEGKEDSLVGEGKEDSLVGEGKEDSLVGEGKEETVRLSLVALCLSVSERPATGKPHREPPLLLSDKTKDEPNLLSCRCQTIFVLLLLDLV